MAAIDRAIRTDRGLTRSSQRVLFWEKALTHVGSDACWRPLHPRRWPCPRCPRRPHRPRGFPGRPDVTGGPARLTSCGGVRGRSPHRVSHVRRGPPLSRRRPKIPGRNPGPRRCPHHGRPTPTTTPRGLYTERMFLDETSPDENGNPRMVIEQSTSDEPVTFGRRPVLPHRLGDGGQPGCRARAVAGHQRVGGRAGSGNPLNRVSASLGRPGTVTPPVGGHRPAGHRVERWTGRVGTGRPGRAPVSRSGTS